MANTKIVERTETLILPDYPPLADGKKGRILTKHLVNLSLILDQSHYCLLSWLIYQSSADNAITYSGGLLKQYVAAVKAADKYYQSLPRSINHLYIGLPKNRQLFMSLINQGLLLPTTKPKIFIINPNLTYNRRYTKPAFYNQFIEHYNTLPKDISHHQSKLKALTTSFISHVQSNVKHTRHYNEGADRKQYKPIKSQLLT
jgi:hypothetical protein